MTVRRTHLLPAVVMVLGLVAVGCGDDDGDGVIGAPSRTDGRDATTTETTRRPDSVAYCEAEAALETEPPPDSSDGADVAAWAEETVRPLLDEVMEAAPDEVGADLEVVSATLDRLIANGDTSVLDDPDYVAAVDRTHDFDLATCGWSLVDVTAHEAPPDRHVFTGIPDELPAGINSFELRNVGVEHHELRLYREAVEGAFAAEGAVETFLAMSPDQPPPDFAVKVGTGEYAEPGDDGYFVADLTPGKYAAVCFIPIGTISKDQPPAPGAAPHFIHGQIAVFFVS